jgi:hypothetical protein
VALYLHTFTRLNVVHIKTWPSFYQQDAFQRKRKIPIEVTLNEYEIKLNSKKTDKRPATLQLIYYSLCKKHIVSKHNVLINIRIENFQPEIFAPARSRLHYPD